MADNGSGQGNIDLNADPDALGVGIQHIKSVADAAKFGDYLPIRWNEVPRPAFYARLYGQNDEWYRAVVSVSVMRMRKRAERPLTEDEAQLVAQAAGQMTSTLSKEMPVTLATAAGFVKWGHTTHRFPFYTPKAGFNPDVFPSANSPLLMGSLARQMWTMLRFTLYAGITHVFMRGIFVSYAALAQSKSLELDPRLANLRESVAKAGNSPVSFLLGPADVWKPGNTNKMQQQQQQQKQKLQPQSQYAQRIQQAQREQAQRAQAQQQQQQQQPQQPQQQQEEQWTQQPAAPPPQQQQQQQQWQSQPQPPRQPQPQQTQSSGFDDGSNNFDDDFYDDASPMSRDEQRRQAWKQRRPTSGTGESTAWDRLRHPGTSNEKFTPISKAPPGQYGWEALRKGKSPPPRPTNDDDNSNKPTTGDYTFNEADEEKQFARNQAQKDFDAMLEKERQGESDRPTRWK